MKGNLNITKTLTLLLNVIVVLAMLMAPIYAFADDGTIFRKNVSSTPDEETEFASIRMLPLYVPVQGSDGTLLGTIDIINADGAVVETREYAQPLIVHYTDGHVEFIEEEFYGGFPGHGERDAFGSVSLDGGATWKRTNLSNSADLSSINIRDGNRLGTVSRRCRPHLRRFGRQQGAGHLGEQVLRRRQPGLRHHRSRAGSAGHLPGRHRHHRRCRRLHRWRPADPLHLPGRQPSASLAARASRRLRNWLKPATRWSATIPIPACGRRAA